MWTVLLITMNLSLGHERSRKMYAWVWSLPPAVSKFWQFQKCHLKARVHQERVGLQLYPSKLLRLSMLTDHPDSSVTKKKTVWKFVPESMLHPPNTHTHTNVIQGLFLGKQYGSCWTVSHLRSISPTSWLLWGMRCCVSLCPLYAPLSVPVPRPLLVWRTDMVWPSISSVGTPDPPGHVLQPQSLQEACWWGL